MREAPCGCDLRRRAAEERDAGAREAIGLDADLSCAAWGCPADGHPVPDENTPPLPPRCAEVVERVGELTGFTGARTCPLWYASLPWVGEAVDAWRLRESPLCAGIAGTVTSGVLVEAVRLVQRGVDARQAYDAEKQREKYEDERKKLEHG